MRRRRKKIKERRYPRIWLNPTAFQSVSSSSLTNFVPNFKQDRGQRIPLANIYPIASVTVKLSRGGDLGDFYDLRFIL